MAGKFEVYTDKAGKHRFRLKAANGQVIAVGEAYESKAACLNVLQGAGKPVGHAEWPDPDPRRTFFTGGCWRCRIDPCHGLGVETRQGSPSDDR